MPLDSAKPVPETPISAETLLAATKMSPSADFWNETSPVTVPKPSTEISNPVAANDMLFALSKEALNVPLKDNSANPSTTALPDKVPVGV